MYRSEWQERRTLAHLENNKNPFLLARRVCVCVWGHPAGNSIAPIGPDFEFLFFINETVDD